MNDPLEEKTKDCFLCDRLTIFGITLKDSFLLDIKDHYWILYAILEVPLTRRLYKQDKIMVHNIILRNITYTSDEFTYVKPYIKKDNGRTDIKALRSMYENVSM